MFDRPNVRRMAVLLNTADGWTVVTANGANSAHEEHTIVVTAGEPIVLTAA